MQLFPYLSFEGTCEEALTLYKEVLNGTIQIESRYDDPHMEAPENYKNKILHASFKFGNNELLACDSFPGQPVNDGTRVTLCLAPESEDEARRIFDGLSAGGTITMPLEKQFWGALFGQFTDKYGISWMINAQ